MPVAPDVRFATGGGEAAQKPSRKPAAGPQFGAVQAAARAEDGRAEGQLSRVAAQPAAAGESTAPTLRDGAAAAAAAPGGEPAREPESGPAVAPPAERETVPQAELATETLRESAAVPSAERADATVSESSGTDFGAELGAARGGTARTATTSAAAPVLGPDAASRVARVLEMQDAAPARSLSQMTLRVENANGTEDQIRVGLRGTGVDATIDMGSRTEAAQLSTRVDQLRRVLEQHGLETESVRVRAVQAASEAAEPARVAAAIGDAELLRAGSVRAGSEQFSGSNSEQRSQSERREQARSHPDSDPSGNRSRREQQPEDTP